MIQKVFIENFAVKGKQLMGEFYEDYAAKGVFKNLDSTLVARSFVGIFGMYMIQRQVAPELFAMEDDKQIDMMVDMILYGISKNGGV